MMPAKAAKAPATMNTIGTTRLMLTPSSSAVSESSAMVRSARPSWVRLSSSSDRPQISTIEQTSPISCGMPMTRSADAEIDLAEAGIHRPQVRAIKRDRQMLEQDQERHRARPAARISRRPRIQRQVKSSTISEATPTTTSARSDRKRPGQAA